MTGPERTRVLLSLWVLPPRLQKIETCGGGAGAGGAVADRLQGAGSMLPPCPPPPPPPLKRFCAQGSGCRSVPARL